MPIWTDYPTQTTPDDADTLLAHDVSETVVGKKMKRTTWANIKAAIKALADTYYLGIASKAADSDKLDGVDSTLFARQNAAPVGNQVLTSIAGAPTWAGQAPDSAKLGTVAAASYFQTPVWVAWTPTVAGASGTLTTFTVNAKHLTVGKIRHFEVVIVITNKGTATPTLKISLPSAAVINGICYGRFGSAVLLFGYWDSGWSEINIAKALDGSAHLDNGTYTLNGFYEIA